MKFYALIYAAIIIAGGGAVAVAQAPQDQADALASMMNSGYLGAVSVPDILRLSPPPPARRSVAQIRDEEAAGQAVAMRGSARWEQAKIDADLLSPAATGAYSCAAALPISGVTTPKLDALMRRSAADFAMAVQPAKRTHQRQRPFMVNGEPTCTPQDEARLRRDGSYPSGHSAIGWGWGLVLAELMPDRVAALLARGRAFGDSRRVCNVHWLSDVDEGRTVASAVYARLQADPAFQKDLKAARSEVDKLRRKAPAVDCVWENAALGNP